VTSWRYLAWLPGNTSSALMYFSTPQMVHVQFECLPMMRFLRPTAQYGLAGIGTWSRLIFDGAGVRAAMAGTPMNLRARDVYCEAF
jgi:hypothetical protein